MVLLFKYSERPCAWGKASVSSAVSFFLVPFCLPKYVESTETYTSHFLLKFYTELLVFLRVSFTSLRTQALIQKESHMTQQGTWSREHSTVSWVGPWWRLWESQSAKLAPPLCWEQYRICNSSGIAINLRHNTLSSSTCDPLPPTKLPRVEYNNSL